MRFGTWNVRSLYRSGSLTTVARELTKQRTFHSIRTLLSGVTTGVSLSRLTSVLPSQYHSISAPNLFIPFIHSFIFL